MKIPKHFFLKNKKITLNAEKRKVIADQFQNFYESKKKQKLIDAKNQYDLRREKAKEQIEKVVRYHQPQEDVDTIRGMISKYGSSGGDLYHDNCFYVTNEKPKIETDYEGNPKEYYDDVSVLSLIFEKCKVHCHSKEAMKRKMI